jgi:hypothetical protein
MGVRGRRLEGTRRAVPGVRKPVMPAGRAPCQAKADVRYYAV